METRVCTNCGDRKNVDEFNKNQFQCRRCVTKKMHEKTGNLFRKCNRCKEEKLILDNFSGKSSKICLGCFEELIENQTKWCQRCDEEKPLDEFYNSNFYSLTCTECQRQIARDKDRLPVEQCQKLLLKYLIIRILEYYSVERNKRKNNCIDCGIPIYNSSTRCEKCHHLNSRKIERPPYEQLLKELDSSNYLAMGRKYGVSDNAIRKWIKYYEKYN